MGIHWRLEKSESGENLKALENHSTTKEFKHIEHPQAATMVNVPLQQCGKVQVGLELLIKQQAVFLDEQQALKQSLNKAYSRVDLLVKEVAVERAEKEDAIMVEHAGHARPQLWAEIACRMSPRHSVRVICGEVLGLKNGLRPKRKGEEVRKGEITTMCRRRLQQLTTRM